MEGKKGSGMSPHEEVGAILESKGYVDILLSGGFCRLAAHTSHPFAELLAEGPRFVVARNL